MLRDSEEYLNSSESFETQHNFYAGPQSPEPDYRLYSKRTPFYPLVLYTFRLLNLHWNLVYLLQAFLGLFNIYLAFILLSQLIKNNGKSLVLLTLFILFTPSQFIYSQFIMADLWLQMFVMLCMVSFAGFVKTRHSIWLVSLLLFSIFAALTKPVFLFASFGVAVYCLYYFIVQNHHRVLIILTVLPFFTWFAVSSKNEKLTGVFHYSSIGYINLLQYNTNLYLCQTMGKTEREKLLNPLMIVPHTKNEFKKNYNDVNRVCKNVLLSHFVGYSLFHAKGMVYFFLDPGRFDLYNFFRIEEGNSNGFLHKGADENRLRSMYNAHPKITISLAFIFLINILKTLGFIGFIWVQRKNMIVLIGALLVFYIAFLTGPLGASRFALPVELIIMCFAAGFYGRLLERFKFVKKEETISG